MVHAQYHIPRSHSVWFAFILGYFYLFSTASYIRGIESQTIMQQIQAAFEVRNKNVTDITFRQIIPFYGREKRYLLLAHGIRADKRFSGSWEDELFGLFVLDKSFSELLAVIDYIPSGRWNDYRVEISTPDANTILATCQGDTYGDEKLVKKYTTELIHRNYPRK